MVVREKHGRRGCLVFVGNHKSPKSLMACVREYTGLLGSSGSLYDREEPDDRAKEGEGF